MRIGSFKQRLVYGRRRCPHCNRPPSQAERVFHIFGGPGALLAALKQTGGARAESSVYRWTYGPERYGTGGVVPKSAWSDVLRAAGSVGVEAAVKAVLGL